MSNGNGSVPTVPTVNIFGELPLPESGTGVSIPPVGAGEGPTPIPEASAFDALANVLVKRQQAVDAAQSGGGVIQQVQSAGTNFLDFLKGLVAPGSGVSPRGWNRPASGFGQQAHGAGAGSAGAPHGFSMFGLLVILVLVMVAFGLLARR